MEVSKIDKLTNLISEIKKDGLACETQSDALQSRILQNLATSKASVNPNVNIESVRGIRTPKWYSLDIEFEKSDTQSKARAFEISSEGAFALHSIQAYYQYTDSNKDNYVFGEFMDPGYSPNGRLTLCSTYPLFGDGNLKNIAAVAATSPASIDFTRLYLQNMYEIPEFSFNFEIDSVALKWADKAIPGGFIYTLDNPLYFNGDCYVDRSERIIVTAKPDIRVPVKGIVKIILHGYQILGDVTPENYNRI